MEREQATLPFVVPSHLSKLFGLKASVIVEGERDGGWGGANSTCWGDGETAVTRDVAVGAGGGSKTPEQTFFFFYYISLSSLVARPLTEGTKRTSGTRS